MNIEEIAIKLASWWVVAYTIGAGIVWLAFIIAVIIEIKNSK